MPPKRLTLDEYVFKDEEGWWFWDEQQIARIGPFNTEGEARRERREYIEFVNDETEQENP